MWRDSILTPTQKRIPADGRRHPAMTRVAVSSLVAWCLFGVGGLTLAAPGEQIPHPVRTRNGINAAHHEHDGISFPFNEKRTRSEAARTRTASSIFADRRQLTLEECPATCYGFSCDYWADAANGGWTCETNEQEYGCDCSGCDCPADSASPSPTTTGNLCPATCLGGQTCDEIVTESPDTYTCPMLEGGLFGCDCTGCVCAGAGDDAAASGGGDCPATCNGQTCDQQIAYTGLSCYVLEWAQGCDCTGCACDEGATDGDDGSLCQDTAVPLVDSEGFGCTFYDANRCGGAYDNSIFSSGDMCCACGGGAGDPCDDINGAGHTAECSFYNAYPEQCAAANDTALFSAADMCCSCGGGAVPSPSPTATSRPTASAAPTPAPTSQYFAVSTFAELIEMVARFVSESFSDAVIDIVRNMTFAEEVVVENGIVLSVVSSVNATLRGSGTSRLFNIDSATLHLRSLHLEGGWADPAGSGNAGLGGAVRVDQGTVTMTSCALTNNTARVSLRNMLNIYWHLVMIAGLVVMM